MATQAQSQGRYAVVNTLLDTTDVTLIDSLSGRQGDNGRIVYFAIKDGNLPHNLDGQNVVLTAKDSAGKVKQISGVHDMISATGGLFSMLIPGEMYQSAGDIEEAYLSVQDGAGTVISSIPVTFTVLANNILFTANASKDYIDSVQKAVDEANSRISGLNDNIKAQQLAYETLKTSVENLAGQINSKQVAMLNVENHFTETATFDKGIVGNLSGNATTATKWQTARTLSLTDTVSGSASIDGSGNVSISVATPVVTRTVSGTNGMSFKFRRTGNAVHVEVSGNYTGASWKNSQTPNYASELFRATVPDGFAPDDWSQTVFIEYSSAIGFGRCEYDVSSKEMMFTYRGMSGVISDTSKYIVSSVTYTTSDVWPE
ncbi:BppU family phage baseplate upper protein [Weissella confusa]|uniref:BppU family phage baseplate upper protein n=1 Tax=Weissella confusa TaxID=1583 RepID=UPI0035A3C3CA